MTPPASPDDGAHEGKVETAQSDVPAATFGHYGKQAVNPLALLADLPPLMPEERFGKRSVASQQHKPLVVWCPDTAWLKP